MSFTRGGQSNLNAKPRSNLQLVQYKLNEGRIERLYSEMIDGGQISEPAVLLIGVDALQLRFRSKSGIWTNEWQTQRLSDLPRAVEIMFEQERRRYRHVFLVGTGYL